MPWYGAFSGIVKLREGSFTAQIEMKESVIMSHLFPGSGGPELEHLPELVPRVHGAVEVALVQRLAGVPLHILPCTAQGGDTSRQTQQLISLLQECIEILVNF